MNIEVSIIITSFAGGVFAIVGFFLKHWFTKLSVSQDKIIDQMNDQKEHRATASVKLESPFLDQNQTRPRPKKRTPCWRDLQRLDMDTKVYTSHIKYVAEHKEIKNTVTQILGRVSKAN